MEDTDRLVLCDFCEEFKPEFTISTSYLFDQQFCEECYEAITD